MPSTDEVLSWRGRTVYDRDGDKIGSLEEVYLDAESGEPQWGAVKTGLIGSKLTFVPLEGVRTQGDDVVVGYPESAIKDAPSVDADGELSPEEEDRLYAHYERSGGDRDRVETGGLGRDDEDSDVGARSRESETGVATGGGELDRSDDDEDRDTGAPGRLTPSGLREQRNTETDAGITSGSDTGTSTGERRPRIKRIVTEDIGEDGNVVHRETRTEETYE